MNKTSKYKNLVTGIYECECGKQYVNGKLKDKDIERQTNIIDKLHCQFYRYNEETKILY